MKQGKWMFHKAFRNRPAHFFPKQRFGVGDGWSKAQCGYFAYTDMLEKPQVVIPDMCCKKCLRSHE